MDDNIWSFIFSNFHSFFWSEQGTEYLLTMSAAMCMLRINRLLLSMLEHINFHTYHDDVVWAKKMEKLLNNALYAKELNKSFLNSFFCTKRASSFENQLKTLILSL